MLKPNKKLNSFLWSIISICHVYKAFMIINQKSTLRPLCIESLYKTSIKVDLITYVQRRALALNPNQSVSRHVNLKRSKAWCIKETLYLLYMFYEISDGIFTDATKATDTTVATTLTIESGPPLICRKKKKKKRFVQPHMDITCHNLFWLAAFLWVL